ncbi:MAG: Arc family DNA-binding protein [Bacteroidales bacterium]|nr:Arc family DNA-binding protein [Bacteroidales bacterium]
MKKNFALRVDKEIFDAVEKWAAEEFRSANGQIEWILHAALKKAGRLPGKAGTQADAKKTAPPSR